MELWYAPLERTWQIQISMELQKAATLPSKACPNFIMHYFAYLSRELFIPDE